MKIAGNDEIAKYISEATITRTKEPAEKTATPADVPQESTEDAIVNLSQTSREIQRAEKAMESEPNVRSEKVRVIKDKIENGTYEIDYDKTAEKMLNAFFDEII
jgi:negative regulator of flagellin synthesis FlgM